MNSADPSSPRTRALARCTAAVSTAFVLAAQAQTVSLSPVGPSEVTWGQPLAVRAQVSQSGGTCPLPLPSVTLWASGTILETRPFDSCAIATPPPGGSGGGSSASATFSSPADLPFGTFALIASYGSASSQALTVRLNPEFQFVIGGGQGVLRTGLSSRGAASTCSARSAVLNGRANLPVPVPPPNMHFPYEHVTYSAANCTYNGTTAGPHALKALIEFPDNIPADAELWLHSERQSPRWQRIPATFKARQAAFLLTGGVGGDNSIAATVALAVPQPYALDFALQDLWWGGAENGGWGLNIARNGDRLFSTLFIYGDGGKAQWVVMPAGTWDPVHHVYYGDLFIPTGSSHTSYDPERFVMGDPVGKGSLSFVSEDDGYFDYVVRGTAGGQHLLRYKFAPRGTTTPPYAGMWWGGAGQDGWGVSIQQQGQTLFATWYTYGSDGKVTWFYMPGGSWTSATTYTGALYRTSASPWVGGVYNPASLKVIPVGTLRLDFSSPNAATMTSAVDGVTLTRPLSRFDF